MARFNWSSSFFVALLASQQVVGQTSQTSSANAADGLQSTTGGPATTTGDVATATIGGVTSTFSSQFTVPAAAQNGANILPNILDPQAVNAQDVCPGYTASNVKHTSTGFTASLSLAGNPVRQV